MKSKRCGFCKKYGEGEPRLEIDVFFKRLSSPAQWAAGEMCGVNTEVHVTCLNRELRAIESKRERCTNR